MLKYYEETLQHSSGNAKYKRAALFVILLFPISDSVQFSLTTLNKYDSTPVLNIFTPENESISIFYQFSAGENVDVRGQRASKTTIFQKETLWCGRYLNLLETLLVGNIRLFECGHKRKL